MTILEVDETLNQPEAIYSLQPIYVDSSKPEGQEFARQYYEWKIERKPVQICIKREVLGKIWDHVLQGVRSTGTVEQAGFLFGKKYFLPDYEYKLYIDHSEAVYDPRATRDSFNYSTDTRDILQLVKQKDPYLEKLGGYHSHLDPHTIFLSRYDLYRQRDFEFEPWQIVMVIKPKTKIAGFFIWETVTKKNQNDLFIPDNFRKGYNPARRDNTPIPQDRNSPRGMYHKKSYTLFN